MGWEEIFGKSDSGANVTLQIREIVALFYYELDLPPIKTV